VDFQLADIDGSMTTPSTTLPNAGPDFAHFSESQRLTSFGTVRSRIGFLATPDMLLFATGGFAFGRVSSESHWQYETPPFAHYDGYTTATKTGYTVGGGAEWALNRIWSVKVEYLYFDLGTIQVVGTQPGVTRFFTTLDQKVTGNIVRAGLNFHF
jgi:outer membrane immunogenic protein